MTPSYIKIFSLYIFLTENTFAWPNDLWRINMSVMFIIEDQWGLFHFNTSIYNIINRCEKLNILKIVFIQSMKNYYNNILKLPTIPTIFLNL